MQNQLTHLDKISFSGNAEKKCLKLLEYMFFDSILINNTKPSRLTHLLRRNRNML